MKLDQFFTKVTAVALASALCVSTAPKSFAGYYENPCEQGYTPVMKTDQWGETYFECPAPYTGPDEWGSQTPPPDNSNPSKDPNGGGSNPNQNNNTDCASGALTDDSGGDSCEAFICPPCVVVAGYLLEAAGATAILVRLFPYLKEIPKLTSGAAARMNQGIGSQIAGQMRSLVQTVNTMPYGSAYFGDAKIVRDAGMVPGAFRVVIDGVSYEGTIITQVLGLLPKFTSVLPQIDSYLARWF